MEGLLIDAVAFVLATFSASFVSKQVADYLVGYQLQEELERNQAEEGMVAKSVTETESSVVGVSVNIGTEEVFFYCHLHNGNDCSFCFGFWYLYCKSEAQRYFEQDELKE